MDKNTELLKQLDARLDALEHPDDGDWVRAAEVPARFGISTRTLERWLRDKSLGFPRPAKINGRRYFSNRKLRAFKAGLEARSVKEAAEV